MQIRLIVAVSLVSTLVLASVPSQSAVPPKVGAACNKQGSTKTYLGKNYTCVKSGNRTIWAKAVITKKKAPEKELPPTSLPNSGPSTSNEPKKVEVKYAPPSLPSENVELCKVKQSGNDTARSGFPTPTPLYRGEGVVRWALIPLDFSDLPGEANFMIRAQEQMQFASEWAENTSEGKLKIEWKVQDKWIRMPGLSTDYAVPLSDNRGFGSANQVSVFTRVMSEADKYFDFTGIQAVQFILPAGQKVIEYGVKGNIGFDAVRNYITGEGTRIDLFSIPSTFNEEPRSGRSFWSWWMYHYVVGLGVAKFGGSRVASPLHTYLIQGSTEGARDLGGWTRFLIGWMPESRVYCRLASNLTNLDITLIPLTDNKSQGVKLAVIPLSETKTLVLESRRVTKFSCMTSRERNGVLAYIYDSTLGHEDAYFQAIAPPGRSIETYSCFASPESDLLLHEGDRVTYEGITIEVKAHGDFDQIRLYRAS